MTITGSAPQPSNPRRKRRRAIKYKQQLINDDTVGTQYRAVKRKTAKNKRVSGGSGKKKTKIPSRLRKVITQVVEDIKFSGKLNVTHSGAWDTSIPSNQCRYDYLCRMLDNGSFNTALFSAWEIMNAVKDIYFQQPYLKSVDALDYTSLYPVRAGVEPSSGIGSSFEFDIINSYAKYHFKNNTQRTFIIELYNCASATNGQSQGSTPNLVGTVVPSANFVGNPLVQSNLNISTQKFNGLLNAAYNRDDVTSNLWEVPGLSKMFPHETTKMVIGPGQTENWFVQGPKNVNFKWAKLFKNDLICDVQKYTRFPLMRMEVERLTFAKDNTLHGVPRYDISNYVVGPPPVNADPLLEITCAIHYEMQMPEQTLGQIPSVGLNAATARKDKVFHRSQFFTVPSGGPSNETPTTVLPANPIAPTDPDTGT